MYEYKPTKDLRDGLTRLIPYEMTPWDDYFLRMAQTDFLEGRHNLQASKTYFYRKAPFEGSYALFGGLCLFLNQLENFSFTDMTGKCNMSLEALKDQGYDKYFIEYLSHHPKLNVSIYAPPEGSIILPNEPVVIAEGSLLSIRVVEGLMRSFNYGSLSLTKWHRVCQAAMPGATLEFARRRAQNCIETSIYAHLAGCSVSSNSEVRKGLDINIVGTMGHEWVQGFGDEYQAFDRWVYHNPDKPILLVDTIDTLKSGIPNAIKIFKKYSDKIQAAGGVPGVRFDSGDLSYLAIETTRMFQEESHAYAALGFDDLVCDTLSNYRLYMTNDLDEYSIEEIKGQIFTHAPKAGFSPDSILKKTVWASGTKPGTCYDQPSFGGVAKLGSIEKNGIMKSVVKIAKDNPIKTSIPGNNRSTYIWHGDNLVCCLIHGKDEDPTDIGFNRYAHHPDDASKIIDLQQYSGLTFDTRQACVYSSGGYSDYYPTTDDIRHHVRKETDRLHWTHKRLSNPHTLKVSLSESVFLLRQKMINNFELIEE
jgi:nicotinate phosphoribosyltransferase